MNANDLDNIRQILIEWKLDIGHDPSKVMSQNTIKQMARHYGLDEEPGTHLYDDYKRLEKCEQERKRG